MAVGDAAAAKGISVVPGTRDLRLGYEDINRLADALAAYMTANGTSITNLTNAINNGLAGKAPNGHTHTTTQITNLHSDNIPTRGSVSVGAIIDYLVGRSDAGVNNAAGAQNTANAARQGDFDISVWNRLLSGTREQAYLGNTGQILLGRSASSKRFKDNITEEHGIDPEAYLRVPVVLYQWIQEIRKRDDPAYADYVGPEHHVAVEVGMIAEALHAAGLWQFVIYERKANGTLRMKSNRQPIPHGIHYNLLPLAEHVVAQYLDKRLTALEARLDKMEAGA